MAKTARKRSGVLGTEGRFEERDWERKDILSKIVGDGTSDILRQG
jgi:hypothetical protein